MKQKTSPQLGFEKQNPLHDFYTWGWDPSGDGPAV